jgi:hypothetical protein
MTGAESTAARPGDEPPAGVGSEILWRVAARLFRDHQPGTSGAGPVRTCAACDRPWPCSGVRMAQLGLSAARG